MAADRHLTKTDTPAPPPVSLPPPCLPVKDRLDDVGCEQGQAQHAGHVGRRDAFAVRQFSDGYELARFQNPFPTESACQRLDQRAVGPAGLRGALRHLHLLPPAAPYDAGRYVERNSLRDRHTVGHAASPMPSAIISRARPARPSTRSRTLSPSMPISTRSTRSATMRACSAGNSSSHSGSICCRAPRVSASVMSSARGARRLPRARHGLRLTEHGAKLVDDGGLDLARRNSADGAWPGTVLQPGLADKIAIQPVALAGMRRREGGVVRSEQQPLQQRGRLGAGARGAVARACPKDGLDAVPRPAIDDRFVLAGIALALVHRLSDVGAIVQHPVQVLLVDPVPARRPDAALRHLTDPFRAEPISRKRAKIQWTCSACSSSITSFRFSTR